MTVSTELKLILSRVAAPSIQLRTRKEYFNNLSKLRVPLVDAIVNPLATVGAFEIYRQ